MTKDQIEKVAAAIDGVQLFSRLNDWTSDHVPGLPIEICKYVDGGEIVVIRRYPAESIESDVLAKEVSTARAIAAIEAMKSIKLKV